MKKILHIGLLILLGAVFTLTGCKKYLQEKSDRRLVIPNSLKDLQALLDNYGAVNFNGPSSAEVSADDYYLNEADYNGLFYEYDQHKYTWQKEDAFAPGDLGNDWETIYNLVYLSNTVLDQLDRIPVDAINRSQWDNVKGQALLFRGKSYLEALQIWSLAYDKNTSSTDLGIPIRLNPDFNEKSVRLNLEQGYERVLNDLHAAAGLLPVSTPSVLRASKCAAYSLLARTNLSMRNYNAAGLYADSALAIKSTLIDYNTLDASQLYPINETNEEMILETGAALGDPLDPSRARIPEKLYNLYNVNDLRKTVFFRSNDDGTYGFKGEYLGSQSLFLGVATDELYLVKAECEARLNNPELAMSFLNQLLIKRYKTGTYINKSAGSSTVALNIVKEERRKELLMRGLRWSDLKRYNKEGDNITLTRALGNAIYTLAPNSLRYALPIPEDIIGLSGMPQNQ
jgi:hypothetical protein